MVEFGKFSELFFTSMSSLQKAIIVLPKTAQQSLASVRNLLISWEIHINKNSVSSILSSNLLICGWIFSVKMVHLYHNFTSDYRIYHELLILKGHFRNMSRNTRIRQVFQNYFQAEKPEISFPKTKINKSVSTTLLC